MSKKDRVIRLVEELIRARSRVAELERELETLLPEDMPSMAKKGRGRPPQDGETVSSRILRALKDSGGPLSINELVVAVDGPKRKTIGAMLSAMASEENPKIERTGKAVYKLK